MSTVTADINLNPRQKKLATAAVILRRCIGKKGIWADPSRYKHQCWTRDLVLAVMPWLLTNGKADVVRKHLENLSKRQRPNGQIPIIFLDNPLPFLIDKTARSLRDRKMSFMLGRFLKGELWNLTPGTRDSEILYVIGMHEYVRRTGNIAFLMAHVSNINKALDYVEKNLMRNGLVIGCDWRDTMEKELGTKPLLTNNSLLHKAYILRGEKEKAQKLRGAINERFWQDGGYIDYPGSSRFDPLGGALAVLCDVAPPDRYASLIESFQSVDSPHGVTIKCRHNPISEEEAAVIDRTDGVVVWPFVVGFSILALLKMRAEVAAEDQLTKLMNLDGFREWYDPATGKGYGAQQQLWSATLLLRSATTMRNTLITVFNRIVRQEA